MAKMSDYLATLQDVIHVLDEADEYTGLTVKEIEDAIKEKGKSSQYVRAAISISQDAGVMLWEESIEYDRRYGKCHVDQHHFRKCLRDGKVYRDNTRFKR